MSTILISRTILLLINTGLLLWAFSTVQADNQISRRQIFFAYTALFLLRFPIYYTQEMMWPPWFQMILRLIPGIVFLKLRKGKGWSVSLYLSFLTWTGLTLCSNVFYTPILKEIRDGGQLIGQIFYYIASFLAVTLISRTIDFNNIRSIKMARFCLMGLVVFCQLYITQSVNALSGDSSGHQFPSLLPYLLFLQAAIAATVISFERYMKAKKASEEMRIADLANRYRYEAARSRLTSEKQLQELHHDMKHHLIALRHIVNNPEKLEDYIDNLTENMLGYESLAETGNELLNGVITEKLNKAREDDITIISELDFRPCNFMSEIDICAIFGNLLDNAIEASRTVFPEEARQITLRSRCAAGCLAVSVSNPYTVELKSSGGRFLSTKRNARFHGIGLENVRRSLEKYQGTMTIDLEREWIFSVILLIPYELV